MPYGESDTRSKLIDPALHARGWTEDLIAREQTAGHIAIVDGRPRRLRQGRIDYVLRVRVTPDSQPVALALIEAKPESAPPATGLEQAKAYARSASRLNVPFVFATNGHLFVEHDRFSGRTTYPLSLSEFPTPADLRLRYEAGMGFQLAAPAARPLLQRYPGGEATRRYYQDAAIRAVLEKNARDETRGEPKRALLSLATGAGKTFIAVRLLKRIADAGQLTRALFLCDRDELRKQASGAFQNIFGSEVAIASAGKPETNARIIIATYQTLGVDHEGGDASFLRQHYPVDFFSHIIVDECHRSAWGRWSEVLTRNPNAVQVGLTATPRQLAQQSKEDAKITADNLRYFGEPVYEYDIGQGIEDGYLAACEVVRREIFLAGNPAPESATGVERHDLEGKTLVNARTGEILAAAEAREKYDARSLESRLLLPERVGEMCRDLFENLLLTGGPKQKTVIFCNRDSHADRVAIALNNLYADWCAAQGELPVEPYAFKCTANAWDAEGLLADLKASSKHHFIATTVDLLTTGVDIPPLRNVVFFRYVESPIAFYQMVGRGTRIDAASEKLMFRVYDYTNASRLFGTKFITEHAPADRPSRPDPETDREPDIVACGITARVTPAGLLIPLQLDGETRLVPMEEYKQRLAARLIEEAATLDELRARWVVPAARRALLAHLPDGELSALRIRQLEGRDEYDLYDILADLGYGVAPRTRTDRAAAFDYKQQDWLAGLPDHAAATLRALAAQFALAGTEGLEKADVFDAPQVRRAGGFAALKALGKPGEVLRELKARLLAA